MEKITDISQNKRLKDLGINLKTTYLTDSGLRERNSDQSRNQDVIQGIRVKKEYFQRGRLLGRSRNFDSRILYSYESSKDENGRHCCPNCGAQYLPSESGDGCPYCGSFWNLNYSHKDFGSKDTYDRTMHHRYYLKFTIILDLLVSFLLSFLLVSVSGRTFNVYDIAKAVIYGIFFSCVLFFLFYYLDALIVLWPVRCLKDRQNQKQIAFWKRMENRGIQKDKFYNNFHYEISRYYFEKLPDIIDYDILDYNSLQEVPGAVPLQVQVNATLRLVHFEKGKLQEEIRRQEYLLTYGGPASIDLHGGLNQIHCRNCGASIDVTTGICTYCGTRYGSFQEWFLAENGVSSPSFSLLSILKQCL